MIRRRLVGELVGGALHGGERSRDPALHDVDVEQQDNYDRNEQEHQYLRDELDILAVELFYREVDAGMALIIAVAVEHGTAVGQQVAVLGVAGHGGNRSACREVVDTFLKSVVELVYVPGRVRVQRALLAVEVENNYGAVGLNAVDVHIQHIRVVVLQIVKSVQYAVVFLRIEVLLEIEVGLVGVYLRRHEVRDPLAHAGVVLYHTPAESHEHGGAYQYQKQKYA